MSALLLAGILIPLAASAPVLCCPPGPDASGPIGYLVIEDARDPQAGFHWVTGEVAGFRTLRWSTGQLVLPDSLTAEDFSRQDLGVVCTATLVGSGASGQLVLPDGIFQVSEPVVLSDGVLELKVSGGELEIRGTVVRYRALAEDPNRYKSGLLMLAGMTVLVIALLRRARLRSGERSGF